MYMYIHAYLYKITQNLVKTTDDLWQVYMYMYRHAHLSDTITESKFVSRN